MPPGGGGGYPIFEPSKLVATDGAFFYLSFAVVGKE